LDKKGSASGEDGRVGDKLSKPKPKTKRKEIHLMIYYKCFTFLLKIQLKITKFNFYNKKGHMPLCQPTTPMSLQKVYRLCPSQISLFDISPEKNDLM